MKKLLLPLLCVFLAMPLTGCAKKDSSGDTQSSENEQTSEGNTSEPEEVDPRANSLLPKDATNPHKIELGELSDYSEVIETYSKSAVIDASLSASELKILSSYESALYGDGESSEDYRFFKDEFITCSTYSYDSETGERLSNDEAYICGNINDHYYRKVYDSDHDFYSYEVRPLVDEGETVNSFLNDYLYVLEESQGYLITDDYIYLYRQTVDERSESYLDVHYNVTMYTDFYIELTKDLRLSATYTYYHDIADHVLPSGEVSSEGFLASESATLVLAEHKSLTDYPKKQQFYNSFPSGMCKSASIKFYYQEVTLTDGEITSFGSVSAGIQNPQYKRIDASQSQIAIHNFRLGTDPNKYVALRTIEITVYIELFKDLDPNSVGENVTHTQTFQGIETFSTLISGYEIKTYEGQNFFVMPMTTLISLIAINDSFSLTPNVSLNEYHS